jgi:predicted pyridoxine 5'-phosphate oxidase superfamily flavin-nucleotide-binding protein
MAVADEQRRRNRLTGRVTGLSAAGFQVAIDQSFGNCPQYIQARAPAMIRARGTPGTTTTLGPELSPLAIRMITAADTLFIASASPRAGSTDPSEGADVNHRGGKPGFVKVTHEHGRAVLTIPDFSGNRAFNTLGNILLYPRAGLLFTDFASGDLLSLTGTAEIIWEGPDVTRFAGAERLLRVTVEEARHVEAGLPFSWSRPQPAREPEHTGEWTA